jgi:hypothetical protein
MEYKPKRRIQATSIPIVPEKMRNVLKRRFLAAKDVGPMVGRCENWMSVILTSKKRINFYVLDDLATALGIRADDLIEEIIDRDVWESQ